MHEWITETKIGTGGHIEEKSKKSIKQRFIRFHWALIPRMHAHARLHVKH